MISKVKKLNCIFVLDTHVDTGFLGGLGKEVSFCNILSQSGVQ